MKEIFMNPQQTKSNQLHTNYTNISLVKLIMSLIIVIFHLRPFYNIYPNLDYFINSGLGRICVPFFFFTSGYFIAQKEEINPHYLLNYNKRNIKTYFIWSCIYLPLLISFCLDNYYLIESNVQSLLYTYNPPLIVYPLLLIAIVFILILYSGVYYHLWFYPALILSINIVSKWNKKYGLSHLMFLSFILLLFGATETYWGFLSSPVQSLLSNYYDVFFTTRNFLFFGLFYVCFGYTSYQKRHHLKVIVSLKHSLILSIILFLFDLILIKNSERLNSNILLSMIPLTYYIFFVAVDSKPLLLHIDSKVISSYSKYIYLIHPFVIFLVKTVQLGSWYSIIVTYSICLLLTRIIVTFNHSYKYK